MKTPPGRPTSPLHIDCRIESPLWESQPLAEKTVRNSVLAAAAALSTAGGEVSIVLTDDSAIRSLNRNWRGIDKPTNVLSFPASGPDTGDSVRRLSMPRNSIISGAEAGALNESGTVSRRAFDSFATAVRSVPECDASVRIACARNT